MTNSASAGPVLESRNHKGPRTAFWIGVLLLTLLAAAMRFYWLDRLPAGLLWDEAHEGFDAVSLLGKPPWHWPLFFLASNGREPLFVYLLAIAQSIAGISQLAVRFVPALIGVLLTPALIWLAWELGPALGVSKRDRFALWAGLAVLGLLWSQMQARIALRNGLFLLLEIVVLAALWRAWRGNRLFWWVTAGAAAGLAFYTYIPVRVWPLAFIPVLVLALLRYRPKLATRWPGMLGAVLAACAIAAPLAVFFVAHPETFSMRTSQVDILTQGWSVVWSQVRAIMEMAFVRGDGNIRVNLPGRPVLDPLMVLPFLIGAAVMLRRWREPVALLLLGHLAVMLLPTMLSDEPPNFGRAIGALPVFVLFVVLGLDRLAVWAGRLGPAFAKAAPLACWGLLLASTVITARAYFVTWGRLPALFFWWDQGYSELAGRIATNAEEDQSSGIDSRLVYISPQGSEHPSVLFGLAERGVSVKPAGFDGSVCVRLASGKAADYYFVTGAEPRGEALLRSYVPEIAADVAVADPYGREWARAFHQAADAATILPEMTPREVEFDDGIRLLGYWLSQGSAASNDRLYLRLFWQASKTPTQGYSTFVHMNRAGHPGEPPVAGSDALPGKGACPTTTWQPGEVIVDELQLVVPPEAPAGEYSIEIGLYLPETMERLRATGGADQVSLTTITKIK